MDRRCWQPPAGQVVQATAMGQKRLPMKMPHATYVSLLPRPAPCCFTHLCEPRRARLADLATHQVHCCLALHTAQHNVVPPHVGSCSPQPPLQAKPEVWPTAAVPLA